MRRSQVLDVTPVSESDLCDLLHCSTGEVSVSDFISFLSESGFTASDPRLRSVFERHGPISIQELTELKRTHLLVQKALHADLAIPQFGKFTEILTQIFNQVKTNATGSLPTYIPQLAQVSPDLWGVSVCTVDGQRFSLGDCDKALSVQSVCKPINYAIAIDSLGVDAFHRHVGMEPSGRNFNERVLLPSGVPHNPLINTGAIVTTSLLFPELARWERFEKVSNIWNKLGATTFSFLASTYLAEREAGNRNFCLAHMIAETATKSFPRDSKSIEALLDDYFAFCSLGVTTDQMAVVAATLANGGLNPITEERAITRESATCTLSVMMTCGMYDASGEFSATSGFPAKSGVSGIIMAVIPGVCGICTYSPLIDTLGNSVRGLDFFKRLAASFSPQIQTSFGNQFSWRVSGSEAVITKFTLREYSSLWWSAWSGDELRIRQLAARGISVNEKNYSNRDALNFAISGGNTNCVKLLIQLFPMDNLDSYLVDAHRVNRMDIVELLLDAKKSNKIESSLPGLDVVSSKIPVHRFFTLPNGLTVRKAVSDCGLDPEVPLLHIRALCGKLVIPNWPWFTEQLKACLSSPISLLSVDGQSYSSETCVPLGRIVRVVLYEIAIAKLGSETLHAFVGKEPSGQVESSLRMNADGIPYNPLTLSGCLTVCHLLLTVLPLGEILLLIRTRLGLHSVKFDDSASAKYRETVQCLLHLLGSENACPPGLVENGPLILELFEVSHAMCVELSVIARYAKSLASEASSVLSILFSCGLDELSGEWSFKFGLPAKSSGQGVIMVVVPGIMGYAVVEDNSWKFQTAFDRKFNVHIFKRHFSSGSDPTLYYGSNMFLNVTQFLNSAFLGDLSTMKNLVAQGLDVNSQDQDGRTAFHVAQSVGNRDICSWLISRGADVKIPDSLSPNFLVEE